MKTKKCASFFAGVGGIDLGFKLAGFETVYANEIDPVPVKTFEENWNLKVDCRDINKVKSDEIPEFDIMLGGFPCQAFSVAGYRKALMMKRVVVCFSFNWQGFLGKGNLK